MATAAAPEISFAAIIGAIAAGALALVLAFAAGSWTVRQLDRAELGFRIRLRARLVSKHGLLLYAPFDAVIPLDELWKRLDKMTASITGAGGGSPIVVNVYGAEGQSVRSLADEVRRVLIEEEKRRRLAWQL